MVITIKQSEPSFLSAKTEKPLGRPSYLKAIQGLAGGGKQLRRARRFRPSLFLQFQDNRQTSLRRRLEDFDGGGPVDGAFVGREMLVLVAVIVVEVNRGDQIAQRRETFFEALIFRQFGEVRVADIKIEAEAGETGFVDEGTEITGVAHLAGGVFNADRDARVVRMEDEVLQGAEGRVAFAWIGHFT